MTSPHHGHPQYFYEARHEPQRLVQRLREATLEETKLTFAAEAAGLMEDHDLAVSALIPLVSHASPIVREGVLYGLWGHAEHSEAAVEAIRAYASDPSPTLRDLASDFVQFLD